MPNISTICWIFEELNYDICWIFEELNYFIFIVLKWETHGFDCFLQVSLQEPMIMGYFLWTMLRILLKLSSFL